MCFCSYCGKTELPTAKETKDGRQPTPNLRENRGGFQAVEKEDVPVTPQRLLSLLNVCVLSLVTL